MSPALILVCTQSSHLAGAACAHHCWFHPAAIHAHKTNHPVRTIVASVVAILLHSRHITATAVEEDLTYHGLPPDVAEHMVVAATYAQHSASADPAGALDGQGDSRGAAGRGDVILSGRVGHAECINGTYHILRGQSHDKHPVFVHASPIPEGFSDSGKNLHMFYHQENDAWAVSTDLGSLDVLAYILGNVLHPQAPPTLLASAVWNVSNGAGDYEEDPAVHTNNLLAAAAKRRARVGGKPGIQPTLLDCPREWSLVLVVGAALARVRI